MVFPVNPVPPADQDVDPSDNFNADVPFDVKQAAISTKRHRWFDVRQIGTPSTLYSQSDGLNAGAQFRIQFDNRPDWIIVSISGQTAATGRVRLFLGEPGGFGILLGPHGRAVVPSPLAGVITLVNIGSTPTFGNIIAVAGYTDPGVDVSCGD